MDPKDLVRELNDQSDVRDRASRRRPVGGSASVTYKDTDAMANLDNCWCGRPVNHDWLGKDEGAPHPRYPD